MPFLQNMSSRVAGVWDYISPRKTQKRRDKPFKIPALPVRARSVDKYLAAVTPRSKVDQWVPATPTSSTDFDETLLPPSPPTSFHREEEDLYYDFDGDTLVHNTVEYEKDGGADGWDANDSTMLVDDGHYLEVQKPVDHTMEQYRQEVQSHELRLAGWPEDAVFLFQKLNMRGSEPLLPYDWNVDFPSLPMFMFTRSVAKQFIKAEGLSDFRAQYALGQLFAVGSFARDAVHTRAQERTAERHIVRAVKNYSQWAMRDGGLQHTWKDLNVFDTVCCDPKTPSYVAEQKMVRKLHKLHEQWDDEILSHDEHGNPAPEELPTLYGVIASHTVMAFVSYVLPAEANPNGSLRTVAIFDFGDDEGFDVWNSFAIAIFAIHCRNRMQDWKAFLPAPIVIHKRDPDL